MSDQDDREQMIRRQIERLWCDVPREPTSTAAGSVVAAKAARDVDALLASWERAIDERDAYRAEVERLSEQVNAARTAIGLGWFVTERTLAEAIERKCTMFERDAKLGSAVREALGNGARSIWYAIHAVSDKRQASIDEHGGSVGSTMVAMSCAHAIVELTSLAGAITADREMESREKAERPMSHTVMTLDRCGRCGWPMAADGCAPGRCIAPDLRRVREEVGR